MVLALPDNPVIVYKATNQNEIIRVLREQRPNLLIIEFSLFTDFLGKTLESELTPFVLLGHFNPPNSYRDMKSMLANVQLEDIAKVLPDLLRNHFNYMDSYEDGKPGTEVKLIDYKKTFLNIWSGDRLKPVRIADIVKIKSDGAYSEIYLADESRLYASRNLGLFENNLKSYDFIRIHHSCLVNMNHVKFYKPGQKAFVFLNDDGVEYVSKSRKRELLDRFVMIGRVIGQNKKRETGSLSTF